MGTDLVVISACSLQFHSCMVKAHEPMSVQALCPELAGPREIENGTSLMALVLSFHPAAPDGTLSKLRPEIQAPGDELAALIDPDRLRIADASTNVLQCLNDILTAVAKARVEGRVKRENVSTTVRTRSLRPVAS